MPTLPTECDLAAGSLRWACEEFERWFDEPPKGLWVTAEDEDLARGIAISESLTVVIEPMDRYAWKVTSPRNDGVLTHNSLWGSRGYATRT